MSNSEANPEFATEWFGIAERDLERARKRCVEEDWEDAGFRIQQAIEKYLKGILAARGAAVRFTHDLDDLLDDVCEVDASFEEFREPCRIITSYYMWDRYPHIHDQPLTEDEVREALSWAEKIADRVKLR